MKAKMVPAKKKQKMDTIDPGSANMKEFVCRSELKVMFENFKYELETTLENFQINNEAYIKKMAYSAQKEYGGTPSSCEVTKTSPGKKLGVSKGSEVWGTIIEIVGFENSFLFTDTENYLKELLYETRKIEKNEENDAILGKKK